MANFFWFSQDFLMISWNCGNIFVRNVWTPEIPKQIFLLTPLFYFNIKTISFDIVLVTTIFLVLCEKVKPLHNSAILVKKNSYWIGFCKIVVLICSPNSGAVSQNKFKSSLLKFAEAHLEPSQTSLVCKVAASGDFWKTYSAL